MNKKFLIFGIVGLFAIGLVAAITYYALFFASFNVLPPITVDGNLKQTFGDVYGGETIIGSPITITNNAPSERAILITDDSGNDVEVNYVSNLKLSRKDVVFGEAPWSLTEDPIDVRYTLVGNKFSVEVLTPIEGYVLIYYADNPDRFNNVSTGVFIEDINENLPYSDDENAENGDYNYCDLEEYVTCHGAKIWYVPETAVSSEGNIDWGQASNFYFETELIQYNNNGELVIYSGQTLTIIPEYTPSDFASGEYTITTTVA